MFTRNAILYATTFLLLSAATIIGQENSNGSGRVTKDGELILTPEELEISRQRSRMLEKPDFIKLELTSMCNESDAAPEKRTNQYKLGSKIRFQITMTNTLNEDFSFGMTDIYDQSRPQLVKVGNQLPYREDIIKLVESKDENAEVFRVARVHLKAGQPVCINTIDLNDWYDALEPGFYELSVKYRLQWGGKWIESPSITFEVIPR